MSKRLSCCGLSRPKMVLHKDNSRCLRGREMEFLKMKLEASGLSSHAASSCTVLKILSFKCTYLHLKLNRDWDCNPIVEVLKLCRNLRCGVSAV